ncbi:MAG TPA: hypothetical protein VGO47_06410 [Chlamydiales bacterium]|nr:hypothetical protein [Chlamydiales bacterium]
MKAKGKSSEFVVSDDEEEEADDGEDEEGEDWVEDGMNSGGADDLEESDSVSDVPEAVKKRARHNNNNTLVSLQVAPAVEKNTPTQLIHLPAGTTDENAQPGRPTDGTPPAKKRRLDIGSLLFTNTVNYPAS